MLFNIVKGWLFSPVRMALKLGLWTVLLGFVGLTVFLLTFNLNSYKKQVEALASSFLREELKIEGDVELGFEGVRPSLVLKGVKTQSMAAERIEIVLPLRPGFAPPFSVFAAIENLQAGGRVLGDYDIPLKINSNGVEATAATGKHDGAKVEADLFFDDKKFHLNAKIEGAKYEELRSGVSDGTFKADIALDAPGPDFVRTLAGHVEILGGKGEIVGDAIGLWAGDLAMQLLKKKNKDTKLECAVASFVIQKGVARSRAVIIDTKEVTIFGKGRIDLVNRRVDMLFTPKPKDPTLFSLATPMRVHGTFGNLRTTPDREAVMTKLGGLLLSAINPAAMFLPMMTLGSDDRNPCLKYLGKK